MKKILIVLGCYGLVGIFQQDVYAEDAEKACKAVQIFGAVARQDSKAFKANTYPAVTIDTTTWDKTPYFMTRQFRGSVTIKPGQRVFLSGDTSASGSWAIDNFILFELSFGSQMKRFLCGDVHPARYNGKPIPRVGSYSQEFTRGLELTSQFPTNVAVDITASALDYGGVGYLNSNIYLVICNAEQQTAFADEQKDSEEEPAAPKEEPEEETENDCLGQVSGVWNTSWGRMIIKESGASVFGAYDSDNGRLYHGDLKKDNLKGFWTEDMADVRCKTDYKGRYYWGCVKLKLNEDCNKFSGSWDYCCDKKEKGRLTGEKVRDLTKKDRIVCSTSFMPIFYRRYSRGTPILTNLYTTRIPMNGTILSTDDELGVEVKEVNKKCAHEHKIRVTTTAKVSSLRGEETRKSVIIIGEKYGIETGPGGGKLDNIAKEGGIKAIGKEDFVPGSTITVKIEIGCPGEACDDVICRQSLTYSFPVVKAGFGTRVGEWFKY